MKIEKQFVSNYQNILSKIDQAPADEELESEEYSMKEHKSVIQLESNKNLDYECNY